MSSSGTDLSADAATACAVAPADSSVPTSAEAHAAALDLREPDGALRRHVQMDYLTARRPGSR